MRDVSAYDDWKSLFTEEANIIWQHEPTELRRVAVLLHIMRQEFKRIENDFESDMTQFKNILETIQDKSPRSEKQVSLSQESPKINKHRRLKHLPNSPSLLHIPKEKMSPPEDENKQEIESFVLDSYSSEDDSSVPQLKPRNLFKRAKPFKKSLDDDVLVDCSIVVSETPNVSHVKKDANDTSKWIQTKSRKKPKQLTITKMLISGSKKRKSEASVNKQKGFDIDKTFCSSLEKENKISDLKINKFNDYDVIPRTKSNSPQHVHKTEVVRKKSERLKLPGWSCSDCEKFYESLNLSPTKLKQKMDVCSKHRSKFPPLCETPQGFWDITMPHTPDPQL